MPATEYTARACTVESHPCPARRRRGKRALLGGLCGAVAVEWALRARKSRFWRLVVKTITYTHCVRCRANLWPWRGCYCGWMRLAVIDGMDVAVLCSVTVTTCEGRFMVTTSAERMRWKRARDRGMVWGEGDESHLSDTALIEQLAIACQKAREGQGNAIALGLLREIAARIGLSGKSL